MSNENDESKKDSRSLTFLSSILVGAAFAFVLVFILFFFFKYKAISGNDLGTFGDYFGGILNPILSFFAFIALIYTIMLQREELKVSREELKLTRQELTRSAEAQEESSKSQNKLAELSLISSKIQAMNHAYEFSLKKEERLGAAAAMVGSSAWQIAEEERGKRDTIVEATDSIILSLDNR